MAVMAEAPDRWHRWLMDTRFGGDPATRERALTELLYPVRDTVLEKARLRPDDTVLDVGTGDGLIAFGALERLGPAGHVVFSDVSRDLFDHCRAAATAEGLLDRRRFVSASADSLAGIADASVDVVTTRSVLIYVKDKAEALREFRRVLRPGGRISVFEPINALMRDPDRLLGYDITSIRPLAAKLKAFYDSIRPPGVNPMLDFDERDLVRHAEQAGVRQHRPRTARHREGRQAAGSLGTRAAHIGKPARADAGRGPGPGAQPAGDRPVHRASQTIDRVRRRAGAAGTRLPGRHFIPGTPTWMTVSGAYARRSVICLETRRQPNRQPNRRGVRSP